MKLRIGRIGLIAITLVTLLAIGIAGWIAYQRDKVHRIVIAAGSASSESYVVMSALKTVVERHYPQVQITVQETDGTTENLRRLERGEAQVVTAQADVLTGPFARIVAVLFDDHLQLLVHKSANIQQVADLKGKRIALPKTGGQFASFMFVAGHFHLHEGDFTFIGGTDDAADLAFSRDEADAVFRVRSLHNLAISKLASAANVNFIPIEQTAAMRIEQPAYTPSTIPEGTYQGNPPVPAADLHTASVERTLLARQDVDDSVIYAITQVLMERREELFALVPSTQEAVRPLLASSRQPPLRGGFIPTTHPGAMSFYNRDKLSFVETHAESLTIILALAMLTWGWIAALNRSTKERQEIHAGIYKRRVAVLMEEARLSSDRQLEPIRAELLSMMTSATRELDRFSLESFQSFHAVWQIAFDLIRNRKGALDGPAEDTESLENGVAVGAGSADRKKPWWSFGRH